MPKLSLTLMSCVLAALLAGLLGPAIAVAQGPSGPDQYIENVPNGDGDGGNASNGVNLNDPQATLPAGADQALDELGADGVRAAALAEALGTEGPAGNGAGSAGGSNDGGSGDPGSGAGSSGGLDGSAVGDSNGRGGLGGVIDTLASPAGDGMGLLLPLLLLGVLIAGGAFAFRTRVSRTHDAAS